MQQRRVGCVQLDRHRAIVNPADLFHIAHLQRPIRPGLGVEQALNAADRVVDGHGTAVGELHALTDRELVARGRDLFPRLSDARNDIQVLVHVHERIVDRVQGLPGRAEDRRLRVEHRGLERLRPDDPPALGRPRMAQPEQRCRRERRAAEPEALENGPSIRSSAAGHLAAVFLISSATPLLSVRHQVFPSLVACRTPYRVASPALIRSRASRTKRAIGGLDSKPCAAWSPIARAKDAPADAAAMIIAVIPPAPRPKQPLIPLFGNSAHRRLSSPELPPRSAAAPARGPTCRAIA